MNPRSQAVALIASIVGTLFFGGLAPAQAAFESTDTFELTVDTTLGSNRFVLPFSRAEGFVVSVDWGDGSSSNSTTVNPDHNYVSEGTYTITITNNGSNTVRFGNTSDLYGLCQESMSTCNKIITSVSKFPTWISSYEEAFAGASSLTTVPSEIPSSALNLKNMFYDASAFNGDISGWSTSAVTNMASMFNRATNFNSDISGWDTSAVTDMSNMFSYATNFQADLSGWDTGSVTSMESMFEIAASFSSNISSWDTSKVTSFGNMFRSAGSFNENLDSWNTAAVTNMYQMFSGISVMAYCLPSWNLDTRSGTTLTGMFGPEYSNAGCVEVLFDSDGGSAVAGYSYKSIYELPAPTTTPTKSDADFLGWASQSGGVSVSFPVLATTLNPSIDLSASSVVRFYAIWESTLAPPVQSSTEQSAVPATYLGPILREFSSRSVLPGDSVEISGQRLASITKVSIDGHPVEILSASNTTLLIRIPMDAESGLRSLLLVSDFGKLTFIDALTIRSQEKDSATGNVTSKVNAGSVNGYLAVYTKGHIGKVLSWKIAGKWAKRLITSDYQVFQRKTGQVGRDVQVDLYLDGAIQLSKPLRTR